MQIGKILKDKCRNNSGFTLIEVIAVLVLISIVAAVVIVRGFSTQDVDIIGQTEVVKSHIRYAQARAMNTNTIWGIYFPTSTTYYLFQGVSSETPVLILGEDNATVDLTTKKSTLTITPPATAGRITFNEWGSPCDQSANSTPLGADVEIKNNGDVTIITVTKNTGFIP